MGFNVWSDWCHLFGQYSICLLYSQLRVWFAYIGSYAAEVAQKKTVNINFIANQKRLQYTRVVWMHWIYYALKVIMLKN